MSRVMPHKVVPPSASLRVIKLQYFIAFAVVGSLAPFLSLFLKQEQGLHQAEVGYAIGASNFAVVLMPLLMTTLADLRQDSRRLIAFIFGISSVALAGLYWVRGFWPTVVLMCLHSLAYVAMTPIQDGLNFALQAKREAAGKATIPFHQIRVWGTIGFILPSLLLFGFLAQGAPLTAILLSAIAFCWLGLLNSFRLPDARPASDPESTDQNLPEQSSRAKKRWPLLEAGRVLRRPAVAIFCLSLMLAHGASATYYAFYPLYLTEVIGIPQQWVGPIFNIGTVFEIGYMLAFGWLLQRLGFKRFMALGIFCLALRFAALAAYPVAAVAITTQALHGMIVVALQIAPALYLNRLAGDAYRTSMQGLLTVLTGASRVAGSVLAGRLAHESLLQAFGYAAALSLIAALLFLVAFHDPRKYDAAPLL